MRNSYVWVHLFVLFFVFALGIFFVSFPIAPQFSEFLAKLILYRSEMFFFIGIIFLILGVFLFFGFYSLHHHRYLKILMDPYATEVNLEIVEKYIQEYWKSKYPEKEMKTEVHLLPDQRLEILVHIPEMIDIEKEIFFEKAEAEIGLLLLEQFNYCKSFIFTVIG